MSKTEANAPIDLSTMLASGDEFIVNGKRYIIKPISLKDIDSFIQDNLSIGAQLFNIANSESKTKVDRWLSGYCIDEKGEIISLQKAIELDWNVVDLKNFFRKLCDLSG